MHKTTACSILLMASALVACGKDKHQEPAMTPAAGEWEQQRQQTTPGYQEPAQQQTQPETQQPPGEWQEGQPGQEGEQQMGEEPAASDPWAEPSEPPMMGGADARLITEARCRRELRCNNIGANKKYASVEECESAMMSESDQALQQCSATKVKREALAACVTAIDTSSCQSPMGTLNEWDQCRSTALCEQ